MEQAELQALLDDAEGGGEVVVPAGTVELTAPLKVGDGVTLRGVGWASRIVFASPVAQIAIDARNTHDVSIRDLFVDVATAANYPVMIDLDGAVDAHVDRCHLTDSIAPAWGDTRMAVLARGAEGVIVERCTIDYAQIKVAGPGGAGRTIVRGNLIRNAANLGISYVLTQDSDVLGECLIEGNIIDGLCGNGGIYLGCDHEDVAYGESHGVTCVNNRIRGAWAQACQGIFTRPPRSTRNWIIAGNTIENTSGTYALYSFGIFVKGAPNTAVSGLVIAHNVVRDVDMEAVCVLGDVEGLVCVGNVGLGAGRGIRLHGLGAGIRGTYAANVAALAKVGPVDVEGA